MIEYTPKRSYQDYLPYIAIGYLLLSAYILFLDLGHENSSYQYIWSELKRGEIFDLFSSGMASILVNHLIDLLLIIGVATYFFDLQCTRFPIPRSITLVEILLMIFSYVFCIPMYCLCKLGSFFFLYIFYSSYLFSSRRL